MPETYSAHESRVYYVDETAYGLTPTNPLMLSVPAESLEPAVNPNNIKVRGVGNVDLQTIKRGLRAPSLKISYPLPSDAPISFLQYARNELEKSLSIQLLYYKGVFSAATDVISLLYAGCKFQKLQVGCSIEDVVKADVELLAQNLTTGTAKISGATYSDYSGAVPFYESYIKKDAAMLDRVTDWKFTIENNLKQVPVIRASNGHLAKYLPHRHRNLTGEVVFEFESKKEFEDVINDEEFSLEFGLGGANKATFSGCKWENAAAPARIEELVSLKTQFVAKTFTIT
ncbi:MAG: phage tail tube protein [Candidatus Bathyarchaeota archaeon]|nr:phage tail tube protein [Candidatus Bathyarchaeota archaeon]